MAVISFHSLEDRIVKRFLARASQPYAGNPALSRLAIRTDALPGAPLELVGRAVKPSAAEIARNPRARSAVLRVAAAHGARAACGLAARLCGGRGVTRVNIVLLVILVACALSLVTSRHQSRRLFVALEREQARGRALETEYGQLQLEQSTWGMPARVEKIAREQLRMQLPSAARTDVVALPEAKGIEVSRGQPRG